MFEPMRVPIATPLLLWAAINAIVNSGREVPMPETVVPTTE